MRFKIILGHITNSTSDCTTRDLVSKIRQQWMRLVILKQPREPAGSC